MITLPGGALILHRMGVDERDEILNDLDLEGKNDRQLKEEWSKPENMPKDSRTCAEMVRIMMTNQIEVTQRMIDILIAPKLERDLVLFRLLNNSFGSGESDCWKIIDKFVGYPNRLAMEQYTLTGLQKIKDAATSALFRDFCAANLYRDDWWNDIINGKDKTKVYEMYPHSDMDESEIEE